ncbi:MAG TPA: hypothetical protein PLK12_00680, partial [Prolixibacteraceae bacterium]|nr:hypothetical protein [Prolixibacteraceae bacterium]
WIIALKSDDNPTGDDAFFNIPNDADDTSLAVAMQKYFSSEFDTASFAEVYSKDPDCCFTDTCALKLVAGFRDTDRRAEDGRDAWKGLSTGAYLTWLKSEYEPLFRSCSTGVIPLAVNNVDCVVNANVLFALAVNNLTHLPGFDESLLLMRKTVFEKQWPEAGLYYPQNMIFPYCLTRAYREGNIHHPVMEETIGQLLLDLVDMQQKYSEEYPLWKGAFPGGEDRSNHLSTALGLCALLHIGESTARRYGILKEFQCAVEGAVTFLMKQKKPYSIRNRNTFSRKNGKYVFPFAPLGYQWESGLFFTSSFSDLAQWRCKSLTAAIVLEALGKYLLEYDIHSYDRTTGPKIHIVSYPTHATKDPMEFIIR